MKRLIIVALVLVVIGVAFYFGYQHSRFPSASTQGKTIHASFSSQDTTTAKDIATNFIQACAAGNWSKASTYCHFVYQLQGIDTTWEGLEIVASGEPLIKYAGYPGLMIFYEIRLKSGELKKYEFSVRNDNPTKAWTVDGYIDQNN
ncbi:MAG: hypothetical protein ACE14V_11780 [bacterium]